MVCDPDGMTDNYRDMLVISWTAISLRADCIKTLTDTEFGLTLTSIDIFPANVLLDFLDFLKLY